jgi:integrase
VETSSLLRKLAFGLRRRELADLTFDHIQRREDHWAIVDLIGKGAHIRTVPVPEWLKRFLDDWFQAANITKGRLYRSFRPSGRSSIVSPPSFHDGCVREHGDVTGHFATSGAIP